MNKLYRSTNYVIIENTEGSTYEFSCSNTIYTLINTQGIYRIIEQSGAGIGTYVIPVADISNWFDESGTTAYTEETFVNFLRANTANFSTTSGGSGVDSVNGKSGVVTLNTDDIPEGNNKYFKDSDRPKYVSKKAGLTRPGQTTIPLANQSGNSNYEEYLKLEYPCTVTDNYKLSISFQWSANTNNTNAKFRLVLTDGTVTNFQEVRIEAKDVGGAGQIVDVIENGLIVGQVDSNTDIILQEYFPIDEFLEAGKTYSISLEFGHESAGSEVTVYSSTIRLEQKTQNP